jgi:hypothetical protein
MATQITNLADGLKHEVARNQELLGHYAELGAVGIFGHTMIQRDLKMATDAMLEGDVVKMLQAYESLKNNQ